MNWREQVTIITGAGSGIGQDIAISLAKKGASVVLAGRREKELKETAKRCGKKAKICKTDVTDPLSVERLVKFTLTSFGRVDILINNAGALVGGLLEKISAKEIIRILDTNLLGTILCSRAVLPYMKEVRKGHIVNMSSIAGTRAQQNMAVYSASKFGVMGFSDSLNLEVRDAGIKVSTIRPATVVTDLWGKDWKKSQTKDDLNAALKPEDVTRTVLFVLSEPKGTTIRDIFLHPAR